MHTDGYRHRYNCTHSNTFTYPDRHSYRHGYSCTNGYSDPYNSTHANPNSYFYASTNNDAYANAYQHIWHCLLLLESSR